MTSLCLHSTETDCPGGFFMLGGNCYKFINEYLTQTAAVQRCANLYPDTSLVEPRTADQMDAVFDAFKPHAIWIGLQFSSQENYFVWLIDGSVPTYSLPFSAGEPDRYNGCGCNDDCIVTEAYNGEWSLGDTNCYARLARVVCQTGEHLTLRKIDI